MTALPIERLEPTRTAAGLGIVEHPADKLARLARHYDGAQFLEAIKSGELPAPPMAGLLGFEIRRIGHGDVTFSYQPSLEHYNGIGVVHGGVAATLLDTVMGCAVQTLVSKGVGITTMDINVRYLRPMTDRTKLVIATGTAVHQGRRTATAEGRVVEAATDRLLATASASYVLVQP